jgi:hypothetical protein
MLTSLAVALIIGIFAIAVGAHEVSEGKRFVDTHHGWAMVVAVIGAFFAGVAGGWVAVKIAGILRSEPAMLHGGIVWLLGIPFLVAFAALGAGNFFGAWNGGLAGTPAWSSPAQEPFPPAPSASAAEKAQYDHAMSVYKERKEKVAETARNGAISAGVALLIGLIGSVIGGWLASGEPMNFTHWRTRHLTAAAPAVPETHTPASEQVVFRS